MSFEIDPRALEALSPDDRRKAEDEIRKLEVTRQRNPLAFYEPHPKQQAFHSFTAQTKCFFGGNQSGKTTGGLFDCTIQAIDRKFLPPHLLTYKKFEGPFLCRIMAESYPVLETTLIPKLQEIVPLDQLAGGKWKAAYEKDLRVLHFANGSKFFFQTYQTDVAAMGGASLHRVMFDEEPPLQVFNECRLRVMAKGGDLLFTMTPIAKGGMTWTRNFLWMRKGKEVQHDVFRGDDIDVVVVDMDDNPTLTERNKELALVGYSKEEKEARKSGKFVAIHGLIYGEFEPERHGIPAPQKDPVERIPETANVVVSIDPGLRHPAAVVWAFVDSRIEQLPNGTWTRTEDVMEVFHELRVQGWTAKQVCEEIHKVNAMYGRSPIYYVIDPAARNKNHETGRSLMMEYADNGIVAIPGQHDVRAGINRVRERFQKDTLHVWRETCPLLIEELTTYRWKAPPKSEEQLREAPVKINDDLVDALRYLVMSRPYTAEPAIPNDETPLQRMMREDMERKAGSSTNEYAISQYGGIAY